MPIGNALAGLGGFLGDQISFLENNLDQWQNRNWMTEFDASKALKDYDKAISDYFLDKQINYNKWALDYQTNLMNTAYQRAVSDMKAAGINPASMAGAQVSSASSPNPLNAGNSYHSGAQLVNAGTGGSADRAFAALSSSAIMAAVAKDNNAARIMANEIVDNARHAHKMEEIRENHELRESALSTKDKRNLQWSKALYYDALTDKLRF